MSDKASELFAAARRLDEVDDPPSEFPLDLESMFCSSYSELTQFNREMTATVVLTILTPSWAS